MGTRGKPLRALMAVALGGLGLAAVPGAAAGSPARSASVGDAPPGWKLVMSDDFTESQLGSAWGEYGGSYEIGANAWSPDEVSVGGGTLRVKMERKKSQGKPYTSGGVATWGLAQAYGRYEFQAMAPAVPGIDSYITLWPPNDDGDTNSMLIELLDKPAVSPGLQAAYVTINYGSGKTDKSVPGSYCGAFHDYVIEWTPTYESVTVDGKLLLKSPGATSVKRWIGFVMSNGDTLTGTPPASAALPAEFDIQHLRVYAYSPGAPGSTATTTAASSSHTPSSASASPKTTTAKPSSSAASSTTAAPSSSSATQPVPTTTASPTAQPLTSPAEQSAAKSSHSSLSGPLLVGTGLVGAAALVGAGVFVRRPRGTRRR